MVEKIPMTDVGFRKLKEQLRQLKEDQIHNAHDIEVAAAQGDRSENAEYIAAKERQSHIAAGIAMVEDRLSRAQVIDPSKISGDRVVFGATVTLLDLDNDVNVTYTVVGEDEADIRSGRISVTAPLARALIGKRAGDEVEARTPGGVRSYEIVAIRFDQ